MLKQLPITGDWIDPREITSVEARRQERSPGEEFYIPDRVIYLHHREADGRLIHSGISCQSFEQAEQVRDEIATMANDALEAFNE